jgi:phage-related holin
MKFSILMYSSLLFIKLNFLPNVTLLGWVFFAVFIDFITGVLKAKLTKQVINSQGFRQTAIKSLQYIGLIVGGIIIGNSFEKQSDIVHWVNDGLLMFILYVEVYSIFENLYAMNPDSKVAQRVFAPAMRILIIGINKNSLNKVADDAEAASGTNTADAAKLVVIGFAFILLSGCKTIRPGVDNSYSKSDTTITNYKPVDVQYKGATVGASFNYDSAMGLMFTKWVKMLPVAQQSLNMDSLYKVFKGSLKTGEIKTVTDPQTKVQLQYWVDEFGKLQMTCSSKDQTIQMMVAEITRLTKEVTAKKTVEVVKEMPWWGWVLSGGALIIVVVCLLTYVIHQFK